MKCEACGAENRTGAKFCMGCGSPLASVDDVSSYVEPYEHSAPAEPAGDNPWLTEPVAVSQVAEPDVPTPAGDEANDGSSQRAVPATERPPPGPPRSTEPALDDPHGFAAAAMRLGPGSRQAGFPALAVAAISLHDGEQVDVLVQGVIGGLWGVALLTSERVLLVTPRLWTPDRITLAIEPGLSVKGWAQGAYASLTFDDGHEVHIVEQITDTILAVELANRLRAEVDKRSHA